MRVIHGENVYGDVIDNKTRCRHYHSELDVVAIKFKCCGRWYPCFECHQSEADHLADVWPESEFDTRAVLCGACGYQLSIEEYFHCANRCTVCAAAFNPGCAQHYHLYFELG